MSEEPLIANVYLDFANFIISFGASLKGYGLNVSVGSVNYLSFKESLEKLLSEQFQTDVVIRSFRIYFAAPRNKSKKEETLLMVGQTVAEIAEEGVTLVEGFYNNADIWCPTCKTTHTVLREKCVDTAIVAHIVEDACSESADVYVLCSGDADFEPALRIVVDKGFKAVIAHWDGQSLGSLGRLGGVKRLVLDRICDEIIPSYLTCNRSGVQVPIPEFAFMEYFQIRVYLSACTSPEQKVLSVYQRYRRDDGRGLFDRAIAWLTQLDMISVDPATDEILV